MRCPKCGSRDDKVIDSRQSRDGSSIRRRRQCLKCKYRYTTYEEIERSDLRVVKAFEKRSTSLLTLEDMVDEIVHELETSGREVPSSAIGAKVLEKLRAIDEVAYLRYASVYQRFQDVDEFVDAVHTLGRRIKPNALQRELFPPETSEGAKPAARKLSTNKHHGRV
jgi:transcriptional repressor NrdR